MSYKLNPTTRKLDYYEKAGAAANGLPSGGTEGQVLAKIDSTAYNAEWIDPSGGASGDSAKYFVKDVADEFTIYSGVNGTTDDEADTNWEVLKIAKTGNDNILRTIYTATGAWADRATLSYSTKYNYEV